VQIIFETNIGVQRVMGRGTGLKTKFEYNAFQPFVGIVSFELDGRTLGIGAYEDDCHMTATKLPFGFETFNLPSLDEVKGKTTSTSVTWNNDAHGTSVEEVGMLDKIEAAEKKADKVVIVNEADHVVNVDFDTTINIIQTPVAQPAAPSLGPATSSGTEHKCLLLDADHITFFDEHDKYAKGAWIDDGQVMQKSWSTGMSVRAIKYCVDAADNTFKALQLVVGYDGKPDSWVTLRKHGSAGGSCRQWKLSDGDYIKDIEYTWNKEKDAVVEIIF